MEELVDIKGTTWVGIAIAYAGYALVAFYARLHDWVFVYVRRGIDGIATDLLVLSRSCTDSRLTPLLLVSTLTPSSTCFVIHVSTTTRYVWGIVALLVLLVFVTAVFMEAQKLHVEALFPTTAHHHEAFHTFVRTLHEAGSKTTAAVHMAEKGLEHMAEGAASLRRHRPCTQLPSCHPRSWPCSRFGCRPRPQTRPRCSAAPPQMRCRR